jgi:CspA family cold shock protein
MKTQKDDILYCDRCGISFLWSQEEQRRAEAKPNLCPGCRYALPGSDRERGLVKWYNPRKRFGFIVRADGPDIFAHGSELDGASRLFPGDLVEFQVGQSERGPIARAITVIQQEREADRSSSTKAS